MSLDRAFRSGVLVAALLFAAPTLRGGDVDFEFFEKRIRPVLVEQCHSCHSAAAEKLKAGLRLDSREHLLLGGDSGPAVVPGEPAQSRLIRAILYDDPDLQMPPKSRLAPGVVEDFRAWVKDGAPWPKEAIAVQQPAPSTTFDLAGRRASHWAWQPVHRTDPPGVHDTTWPVSDLDRFILARLETAGLRPAPRADKRTLIRRATFTLAGLPPTPSEVEAFLRDDSPEALARVVDRLLASPHFGEHWARHWLDKVRYAETMGHEFDYPILGAWRYRDYVVRAFNADVPYDRFAQEQIAGDLLPEPRHNPHDGTDESRLATAQFWFAQQVHSPVDVRAHQADAIDNQIDVVTKAFLGLTVACARCHDHKFDAISTQDYYSLFGILSGSRYAIRAVDDPTVRLRQATAIAQSRERLRHALADTFLAAMPPVTVATTNPAAGSVRMRAGDRRLSNEGWFADGEAFRADSAPAGQPAWNGDGPIRMVRPGWWHSASLSRRFEGALRSPTFTLEQDFLHFRLAGRGTRFGLAIEGFTLIRSPIYGALRQAVRSEDPYWVTLDVSMWKGRRAWLEFADLTQPDPASDLPPDTRSAEGWVTVADVLLSSLREPPETAPVTAPSDPLETLRRWRQRPDQLTADEAAWLEGVLAAARPGLPPDLIESLRSADAAISSPVLAGVMTDGTGDDEPVFIRGNHRSPGHRVPRRFLEALTDGAADPQDGNGFQCGSGRLALARAVTDPGNPFFSRVAVNWVWSHLEGRGLVASVDNFGALGEKPSHPELLDWLAGEFTTGYWSLKGLIREVMLSATWQMSSRHTDVAATRMDPDNVLLHRANLKRLEGEAIRDVMLAVSGRLDPKVGGPPVASHLTEFMEGRGRPGTSGPLDGDGRRSLYLEVRRNFLSPMMLVFDTPVPATTVGRRTVSNVPAQALVLMNDPFVIGQARTWAERILRDAAAPPEARVRRLFQEAYGRPPSDEECAKALEFLGAQESLPGAAADRAAAWANLCHALFNTKEFTFVE